MAKVIRGGSEKPLVRKRKIITEGGFPEHARRIFKHTDPHQVVKTAKRLRRSK